MKDLKFKGPTENNVIRRNNRNHSNSEAKNKKVKNVHYVLQ